MKSLLSLLVLMVLSLGFTNSAKAYKITVLDPTGDPTYIYHEPFDVTFQPCVADDFPTGTLPIGPPEDCFHGINRTGSALTSIELTFNTDGTVLAGAPCPTVDSSYSTESLFGSLQCKSGPNQLVLYFSVGSIGKGEEFTVVENGIAPADFPAKASIKSPKIDPIPEPSSIALLSTGLASMGAAGWRKRRLFASRNS